jgi:hypothetical protein
MASAIEKVIEIAANNLFDNASVQTCLTAVTDLSNNVDARVNAIIDSAPGALNTLNELAAALGDDENYATSTANILATKAVKGSDVSFNDISVNNVLANDVSGVHFFTTGGNFVGNLIGNVQGSLTTAGTVQAGTYTIGGSAIISGSRQINNVVSLNVGTGNDPTEFSVDTNGNTGIEGTLSVDTINEKTSTSGVTIDGVLLKDGNVQGSLTTAGTVQAGTYTIGGSAIISGSRQINNVVSLNVGTGNDPTEFSVDTNGNTGIEGTLSVDTINEKTDASGVTIDGVLLKDGGAILTGDVSGNDAILNDVSGVHFFTTGGNFVGDLVGNATTSTSATTAGTVTTAAQPNITSVGTLTSLVVSGDLSANDCSFNVVDIHTLNLTTAFTKSDVGLGNVDNTTDAGKPVSTAQQTALDLKANLAGPTFTGTVTMSDVSANDCSFNVVDIHTLNLTTAFTKSDVGLGNVDNTTDAEKPVSTAQQTALDLKANLAGPTFTGTVTMSDVSANDCSFNVVDIHTLNLTTAFTKSDVGLGNVDNTTDAEKPVSTAQQTALDLKANIAGPTFTGTVTMSDVSANDGSFNVVDIAALKVNGVSITQNGSGGASLNINSDISINDIHAQDASFNTLRTSETMALGGHIIPTANAQYDLGNAEYKIRHLFLSDNSLWIGDEHKIDVSGGKMRFKKRKTGSDFVPQEILDASGGSTAASHINGVIAAFGDVSTADDIKLHHWEAWVADTAQSGVTGLLPHELFEKDVNFNTDRDLLNAVQLPTQSTGNAPTTLPDAGTMTFDISDNKLYIYNGSLWKSYSPD